MRYFRNITFFFLLIIPFSGNAQVFYGKKATQHQHNASKVWYDSLSKSVKYIEYAPSQQSSIAKSNTKDILNLPADVSIDKASVRSDSKGYSHTRHQLSYKNIPVEGAVISLHYKNDLLKSASGHRNFPTQLNVKPKLSVKTAIRNARQHVPSEKYIGNYDNSSTQSAQLIVLPLNEEFYLCYKVDVYSLKPLMRKFVYVDAHSGKILKTIDRIHHESVTGLAHTQYQGEQEIKTEYDGAHYTLHDQSRDAEIVTLNMNKGYSFSEAEYFSDTDNVWDETSNQDNAATNAHYAFEATYDYFSNTFNQNSYDNLGGTITSYIHFGDGYNNAFWDGNSFVFGDGDGVKYSPLTSTDVVAHEFTHAVTEHSAGLEYLNESGALNESFSDIFGVSIDFHANPATANFLLGDEFSIEDEASRNMANPKQFNHPDTYKGEYWISSSFDNGGVHTNCGVQNYWFYLLAMGGTGTNDLGNTYSVTGIGIEKAAEIAYRNLTVYLSPYSQFADARFFSIQSAIDLYGTCSPEVIAVTNAWYAVGVGEEFSNLAVASFHTDRNYSCAAPALVSFANTSENASTYRWDFGDGTSSTEANPSHVYVNEGSYSVSLKVLGESLCESTDSTFKADFIQISQDGELTAATCEPTTRFPGNHGIQSVQLLNTVCVSGLSDSEGAYIDNTCNYNFNLSAGDLYNIEVITGAGKNEDVALWIDLNNDGSFDVSEQLWYSEDQLKIHTGSIHIPETEFYNVPLRMRIVSDISTYTVEACKSLFAGQGEDYRVNISPNAKAPAAGFTISSSKAGIDKSIQLSDQSLYLPESWHWIMPGASPSESSEQNPVVSYSETGNYDITLIVENTFGSDTLTIKHCVEVLPYFDLSDEESADLNEGILYDNGSHHGNYSNSSTHSFLIQPGCNPIITLNFISFATELTRDIVSIYDGTNATAELLCSVSGTDIPESITAESGSVYIEFITDGTVSDAGFLLHWEAVAPENALVHAEFIMSDTLVTIGSEVQFTDVSSPSPNEWMWNLGDGITANSDRVNHTYTSPGEHIVKLVASNCFSSDTITRVLYVLPPQEEPGEPVVLQIPNDVIQSINDGSYTLNLSTVFTDPDESTLYFDILTSNTDVVTSVLTDDVLQLDPTNEGATTVIITATNDYGLSTYVSFNITISEPTNLQAVNKEISALVFPNPTHDYISIQCLGINEGAVQVDIIGVSGQVVTSDIIQSYGKQIEQQFDLSNLTEGLYQVVIRHGSSTKRFNVIKQ